VSRGKQGILIVVSAPSGAGKTSLCEWAVGHVPSLAHSVSHTTRAPRPHEVDGRHYHFVDETRFRAMAAQGEFAEWAEVHGHLYGTAHAELARHQSQGNDVILDIDTQGAALLRRRYPEAVSVFIVPPSWEVLESRLRQRHSDTEADIQRRLQRARDEVKESSQYQYVVVNDEFPRAAEELRAIILAERLRGSRVDMGFLQG
jgi:guanylate kinase